MPSCARVFLSGLLLMPVSKLKFESPKKSHLFDDMPLKKRKEITFQLLLNSFKKEEKLGFQSFINCVCIVLKYTTVR